MQKTKQRLFYLILFLILEGCTLKNEQVTPSIEEKGPQFSTISKNSHTTYMKFPTINGNLLTVKGDHNLIKITNSAYQNKEVLLYLFGRDCHYCQEEIADIKTLSNKKDIKVIGIHAHKMIGDSALRAYSKKIGYNFDILSFKNDIIMIRYLRKNGLWYGSTPTHLLIDREGNVKDISLSEILNRYR